MSTHIYHILVADKIADAGLARLRETVEVTFDVRLGLTEQELADAIGSYDGILIRSAVKLTRKVFARPGKLAAVARAGVGVDNVDLDAATEAGILVLNTPDANTISTAEHTMAMMLALYRRIPQAHHHVSGGHWERNKFRGGQLAGQTLGIVGLGRIGRAVAERALAFQMNILAFDPFVSESEIMGGVVKTVRTLDELLRVVDCLTLHASLSDQTRHMIGATELAKMQPHAKLINCARGALIDEQALSEALNEGRIGGAAIDVFEAEPPTDSPLLTARNIVLTPHLAASTVEAQTQVSLDAVDSLLAYLLRGEIQSSVNVAGLPSRISPRGRSFVDLCARMGAILSPWCTKGVERVGVTTCGESLEELGSTLAWQALVSVLGPHMEVRLNLVNARDQARNRGIAVDHAANAAQPNFADSLKITVHTQGQTIEAEGTVLADGRPRVLAIDGYRMELVPERTIVLIFNDDQPGVIGLVGQKFGNAGINIADMALSRREKTALMVLKLDMPVPDELRDELRRASPPITSLHIVTLPPVSDGPRES